MYVARGERNRFASLHPPVQFWGQGQSLQPKRFGLNLMVQTPNPHFLPPGLAVRRPLGLPFFAMFLDIIGAETAD